MEEIVLVTLELPVWQIIVSLQTVHQQDNVFMDRNVLRMKTPEYASVSLTWNFNNELFGL